LHLVVLVLLPLRVPPLAVALVGSCVGIFAAVEVVRGQLVIAAILLVLKTVLDNADAQLARASGRVSALGRYLDSESDLLVNLALFAALGYVTGRPIAAAGAFLVLTVVLGANFNLRRLYRRERGDAAEAMPPAEGVGAWLRRVYATLYAPQDRLVEAFVRWRLRRLEAGAAARLAYHDRATLAVLHNFGLSGQLTVLALCLVFARPELYLWVVFACGAALLPLELRRELRVIHPRSSTAVPRPTTQAASAARRSQVRGNEGAERSQERGKRDRAP
jgi:archaetidylinositol phosphate synthase